MQSINRRQLLSVMLLSSLLALAPTTSFGQDRKSATGGNLKGKARIESGAGAENVTVTAMQEEREVRQATTNRQGEFVFEALPPGIYTLTFRKPGLSVGTLTKVEVQAGKTRTLPDRLTMSVDEGTLALIRGSVFNQDGRIVRGARIELARVEANGKLRKIDGRLTNDTGSFGFHLPPDRSRYLITARYDGAEAATKELEVEGASVYRVALSLQLQVKR